MGYLFTARGRSRGIFEELGEENPAWGSERPESALPIGKHAGGTYRVLDFERGVVVGPVLEDGQDALHVGV